MKYIALILCAILLASCSADDVNNFKTDKLDFSKDFENTMLVNMLGFYGTNRVDAEPGTIIITKDSLQIKTLAHDISVKIIEHRNSLGHDSKGNPCWWHITIGNVEYILSTTPGKIWLQYRFIPDNEFSPIGTYYKDFKSTEPEQPTPEILA